MKLPAIRFARFFVCTPTAEIIMSAKTASIVYTSPAWTTRRLLPSVRRSLACAVRLALLAACIGTAHSQQIVTRETEYAYDPVTGLVTVERVDPGGTHCIETSYQHDAYGNRKQSETRPCASTVAAAQFTPRITVNDFSASTDPNNFYPAGAYQTRSRSGTSTQTLSEARATYDPRFGASVSQTEVAIAADAQGDASKNLAKRIEYDGFGRVLNEYAPVKRNADGSLVETRLAYAYVYCQGPKAVVHAACLNLSMSVPMAMPSQRLVDVSGNPTSNATVSVVTAYFVETTPFDINNTVVGARTRLHFDSMHRAIAKETQTYDGRWARALTGYDQLGMVSASWSVHFAEGAASPPPDELRQATVARDLLHRPVEQRQNWRPSANAATVELRSLIAYNGLETVATVPADSTPEGIARTKLVRKNASGFTAHTENADGATISMAYDPVGNLVRTVDALGNTTVLTYTATTARFKTGIVDPDLGAWSYAYDALAQLKSQTDARSKTTTMDYDALGRLVSKSTPALNAQWFYDKSESGAWCASGLNRLCGFKTGNTVAANRRDLTYDALGRAFRTTSTLDRAYSTESSFDDLGRVASMRYPTGLTVDYAYSDAATGRTPGIMHKVSDRANAARVFWRIDTLNASEAFDAHGRLLKAQLGNGVLNDYKYDPISGKTLALRSAKSGQPYLFSQDYEYDKANNLVRRSDGLTAVVETFLYDSLDRLTQHKLVSTQDLAASRTVNLKYNALGNILEKGDVGGYAYAANDKPHAVRSAGGTTYDYDANGNVIGATGAQSRTHTWTDFNLPDTLIQQGRIVAFSYDAGFKRVKQVTTSGSTVRTQYLVHPDTAGALVYEREETRVNGTLTLNESRHYVSVAGTTVVIKTLNDSASVPSDPNLTNYWHKDSLGSVVMVSNASGDVMERMAFDAWGRRIRSTGGVDPSLNPAHGNRGFTGHEHLDEVSLVHMNGRVYDPMLARFMSADGVVESSDQLLYYNRYSYVLNNPLKYTDPSGNCVWDFCIAEIAAFIVGYQMSQQGNVYWRMVGQFMMMMAGQELVEAGLGSYGGATTGSFYGQSSTFNMGGLGNSFVSASASSLAASGGDIGQAIQDGVFALAFTSAGASTAARSAERFGLHALLGCAQGAIGGGKCGPSAMAAVVGKGASEFMPRDAGPGMRGVATVVAGGTASVIGGGKFANGAFQAAFAYLYNLCSTEAIGSCWENPMGDPVDFSAPGAAPMAVVAGVTAVGAVTVLTGGAATGEFMPYGLVWLDSALTGTARLAFVRWWANLLPETLTINAARTVATTAAEKSAMEAARAGAGKVAMTKAMTDPRLQVGVWEKMSYVVKDAQGVVVANIHFVREQATKIVKDFKFK